MQPFGDGRDWFLEKRFGLFVHWGLYSIPAWHEQHQWRGSVPRADYVGLAERFNPLLFDPDAWLDLMERVGMEYICLTTKHHDGFCLWNTQHTDYNIMHTPYQKDILGMLSEACHRRGVPLCLYHSVVDWHHPNYPNQGRSHELLQPEPGDEPDWARYREFMVAQVRELCTNYGEIHGFWWDMNVTGLTDRAINDMIRALQPNAVINNRGMDEGDFGTPERDYEADDNDVCLFRKRTEANQSVGRESWGYRLDEDYYSNRHLIASVDKALAKGANYLLNVGPMADGSIPPEAVVILETIGAWYNRVQESFGDARPASDRISNREALLTQRGNTLYVHLWTPPTMRRVLLRPDQAHPRACHATQHRRTRELVDLRPTHPPHGRGWRSDSRGAPLSAAYRSTCQRPGGHRARNQARV